MSQEKCRDILEGRGLIIGVSGGIAAYKTCSLITTLRKRGAKVRVVMTENAGWFVGETTLAALSGNEVYRSLFGQHWGDELQHVHLQDFGEAFLVAPATANIIGKVANGIADDLLTTSLMATKCPVIFAPAMNCQMWANPILQENVTKLQKHGYRFVWPEAGWQACGTEGAGRLAAEEFLVSALEQALWRPEPVAGDLEGWQVVVSAGPTREALDPVRFLSNRSTGRMGFALAAEARARGAEVTLVAGPTEVPPPPGVKVVAVESNAEMKAAVLEACQGATAFISAAAPADYRPAEVAAEKIKKGGDLTLPLVRTDDILLAVGAVARPRLLVGFAAETGNAVERGRPKLAAKDLDLLVVNDVAQAGCGFGVETNQVTLLRRDGMQRELPLMSKQAVAAVIIDEMIQLA
jgi:phosphopantothenoylcysteine decarboxylase/phosphopantothenate--cysteine ligase